MTPGRAADGPPVPVLRHLVPVPTYRDQPATPVSDLSGVDLSGRPIEVPLSGAREWTLLLFLSSGCDGCRDLWEASGDPAASGLATDERVVVVTHGPDHEDVAALRLLAPVPPAGAPSGEARREPAEPVPRVVMSDEAWLAYRVQGPPFFVLVDGTGDRVATEGVAWGVAQVAEHVRAARGRSVVPGCRPEPGQ